MTTKELLRKTKKLYDENRYSELVVLLTRDELEKHNDSSLYFVAGHSNDECKLFEEAIYFYNKCIEINPNDYEGYNNRGATFSRIGEKDKAFVDFDKAIELKTDYALAYHNRGQIFFEKGEYNKAIDDFNKAILYNSDYSNAYNIRGLSYRRKGDINNAIADYTKAIELDKGNYQAYNNRGVAYSELRDYDNAILDYSRAIKIKASYALPWRNLGNIYSRLDNYDEAERCYEKAVELAPTNNLYKTILDETRAKKGEVLRLSNIDNLPQYAQSELIPLKLDDEERRKIIIASSKVYEPIRRVKKLLLYTGNQPVVHYTSRTTTDILVRNEAKMRYNNGVFMNDPEEGKVFLQYVNDKPLTDAAINGGMEADNNVYIGSFMPHDKDDYLVMWRTYGKNPGDDEATGCSITIDSSFFDKDGLERLDTGTTTKTSVDTDKADGAETIDDATDVIVENPQVLYHVLYYDKKEEVLVQDGLLKEKMVDIEAELNALTDALKGLLVFKDREQPELSTAIDKIIYRFVSELSYLFKSADYQTEQEVRVVMYHSPDKPMVVVDAVQTPPKVYIESNKPVRKYIRKIVMGPKVPHPERWLYLDVTLRKLGVNSKLQSSLCKFQ